MLENGNKRTSNFSICSTNSMEIPVGCVKYLAFFYFSEFDYCPAGNFLLNPITIKYA